MRDGRHHNRFRTKEDTIITHGIVGGLVRSGDVGDGVGALVNGESGRDVGSTGVVGTVVIVGGVGAGVGLV